MYFPPAASFLKHDNIPVIKNISKKKARKKEVKEEEVEKYCFYHTGKQISKLPVPFCVLCSRPLKDVDIDFKFICAGVVGRYADYPVRVYLCHKSCSLHNIDIIREVFNEEFLDEYLERLNVKERKSRGSS